MTRIRKFWDFIFGVILIGGMPALIFLAISFSTSFFLDSHSSKYQFQLALLAKTAIVISLFTFLFGCWWRNKHRLVSKSFFPLEILFGFLFGFLFFVILIGALYAAHRAD
jgi:hypothetical protein